MIAEGVALLSHVRSAIYQMLIRSVPPPVEFDDPYQLRYVVICSFFVSQAHYHIEIDDLINQIIARFFALWPLHQRHLHKAGDEGEIEDERVSELLEVCLPVLNNTTVLLSSCQNIGLTLDWALPATSRIPCSTYWRTMFALPTWQFDRVGVSIRTPHCNLELRYSCGNIAETHQGMQISP